MFKKKRTNSQFPTALYLIMLHCLAEAQALPPVQVFDKTMVVKQMHVLEPQDLLITRADKGKAWAMKVRLGGGSGGALPDFNLQPCTWETPKTPAAVCTHPINCMSLSFSLFYLWTHCSSNLPSHSFHFSLRFHLWQVALCHPSTYLPFAPPPAWWNALISGFHLKRLTYRRPIPSFPLDALQSEPKCVCCA